MWAEVCDALYPVWEDHAAAAVLEGHRALGLRSDRVPQLCEISRKLVPISGFRFEAVPGLVDKFDFFAALAGGRFLSTQYVRWSGSPLYTPEPDVIHEVIGHGHLLACRELAELHRLAGAAMLRLDSAEARQFVADVFWFSGEFGVIRESGRWKAYGAGLLSSIGELRSFPDKARVIPIDIAAMGNLDYDIGHYQPVLFGADSIDEVLDTVGRFFAECGDDSIAATRSSS